jgi:hypothetical protein
VSGWIDLSHPITEADLGRCYLGASGQGNLDDLRHCFQTPVSGCRCSECAGQSSTPASGEPSSGDAGVTPPEREERPMTNFATFSEDEMYEAYLRQTGCDPEAMPSLASGRKSEPMPSSNEVLRHQVEVGRQAVEQLREAGVDVAQFDYAEVDEDALYRAYVEQTGLDPESMPSLQRAV